MQDDLPVKNFRRGRDRESTCECVLRAASFLFHLRWPRYRYFLNIDGDPNSSSRPPNRGATLADDRADFFQDDL